MSNAHNFWQVIEQAEMRDTGYGLKHPDGYLLAWGDTVPTNGGAIYAPGCQFFHLDGSVGTHIYINEGTSSSCDFNPMSPLTAAQENALNALNGTASVLTNATYAINIASSDVATTGTVRSGKIVHTVGVTDLSTIREALYVTVNSAYTTGDWTNAIVGRIAYTSAGNANGGMAAAVCGEMYLPGAAQSGGAYYAIDAELGCPENFTCAGNKDLPVAFMKFGVWGNATAVDSFEATGYLFHLDGVADTSGGLFDATDVDDPDFTHALKINISGVDYFIGLSTSVSFSA